jgi:hypothetical protein
MLVPLFGPIPARELEGSLPKAQRVGDEMQFPAT